MKYAIALLLTVLLVSCERSVTPVPGDIKTLDYSKLRDPEAVRSAGVYANVFPSVDTVSVDEVRKLSTDGIHVDYRTFIKSRLKARGITDFNLPSPEPNGLNPELICNNSKLIIIGVPPCCTWWGWNGCCLYINCSSCGPGYYNVYISCNPGKTGS